MNLRAITREHKTASPKVRKSREKALRQAVHETIERNTPRASSVAFLLRQRHRTMPMPLDLSRYPLAQDVHVRSHDLETYDELARNRDKKSKS